MFRSLLLCLMSALVLLPQAATAATRLVAVLPLSSPNKKVPAEDRETLEETIRTIAGDALVPAGFTVLTGETTLAVLSENGIDSNKACEASCSLEAARELKAELFIAGSMTLSEGNYLAFVRLFDVAGKQLSSVKLEGAKIRDLRAQFEAKSGNFFGKALGQAAEVKVAKAEAPIEPKKVEQKEEEEKKEEKKVEKKKEEPRVFTTANGVYVQFDPPTNTTSWTLMDENKTKLCDLPCKRIVGPNSGYVLVPGDDSREVKIQDNLDVALGRTYNAKAKLPSRMFLLKPGWLAASIPTAALFTIAGISLLAADGAVSDDSSSGSSLLTAGLLGVGVGAAATVWTVFIFKNMRSGGIDLTPMEAAQLQLEQESYQLAARSMPVAKPIR